MFDYPISKGKVAKQAHVALPKGTFEEEHDRDGFFGKAVMIYHAHPPTDWIRFEGKLRPHAFDFMKAKPTDLTDPKGMPVKLLYNDDIAVYVSRRSEAMPFYFRNADGDELRFVHKGRGVIETDYGPLDYEPGDYIILPKATTFRVVPQEKENFFLIIQSSGEFDQPDKGMIGRHALYDPGVITVPEPKPQLDDTREWEIRIKVDDEISSVWYPFNPMDVVGWKGDLTAWKLNIRDIRPVVSPRTHLPPSAHTTFLTKGAVVCSFLPRPLEEDPESVRVPFFHRNTDYDEFLFYHDGDFFSRQNIKAGMVTLHPRGLHHGPHPKAIANQYKKGRTDESAVMLDTKKKLKLTKEAEAIEWKEYWKSWMDK
jgi:homogentisate 1,2-dioxygenase